MEHQHRGRPGGEVQLLPLFQRRQPEGRGIGLEMAHGMRIESGDDGRAAFLARPADRLACHGLVAQVETVEIAQRHDRAAQAFRQWLAVVEEPHAAYSRARSSVTKL